jgi:hypothetical protein
MNGNFIADYDVNAKDPASIGDVALPDQPSTLDRAALHFCMGGPFHPGCEMTWPMRHSSMYRRPFRLRQLPPGHASIDYGEYLTQVLISSSDGPLSASGPGDITKWMAVPWQSDTASCRAGYAQTEFPPDEYIPTFWPSRVPNNVLTEASYQIVIDASKPMEDQIAAFNERPFWLESLDFNQPYIEQITKMVHTFGDLALVEKREAAIDPVFPSVMYVATGAAGVPQTLMAKIAGGAPMMEGEPVSKEFARARFGGLRR